MVRSSNVVCCKKCGYETVDPLKRARQKYCQVRCCKCGYLLPSKRIGREFDRRPECRTGRLLTVHIGAQLSIEGD